MMEVLQLKTKQQPGEKFQQRWVSTVSRPIRLQTDLVDPESSHDDVVNCNDRLAPRVVTLCLMEHQMTATNRIAGEILPTKL